MLLMMLYKAGSTASYILLLLSLSSLLYQDIFMLFHCITYQPQRGSYGIWILDYDPKNSQCHPEMVKCGETKIVKGMKVELSLPTCRAHDS